MNRLLLILVLTLLGASLQAEDAKPERPTIKLFTDENSDGEGLQILLKQRDYPGIKTERIEFEIRIVNRLLEEVFVEVTDLGDAKFCFDGGIMVGGGIFSPDNVPLLKRLHAATMYGKKKVTCACGSVVVKQSSKMDLSMFVGRAGTFRFLVRGFYRSNGKQFHESIDFKFNVIDPSKSEQDATSNGDKPSN